MSADLLRRAAAKIRETAQAADAQMQTLGWTWGPDIDGALGGEAGTQAALWSPDVAELVARLLEHSAFTWDASEAARHPMKGDDLASWFHHETALARRILGEGE